MTEAPVIVLGHLTEAQRRAYRIADNKRTELGTWDEALLSAELNDLLAEDFYLSLVGCSDGELDTSTARLAGKTAFSAVRGIVETLFKPAAQTA